MKNERGSLTVLGLFTTLSLLLLAAVLISANSLYLQQRQLNNLGDALALDLADLNLNAPVLAANALGELEVLNATGRQTELVDFGVDGSRVTVALCQNPDLLFDFSGVIGRVAERVCSRSTASADY